jgi:hypothetical protein
LCCHLRESLVSPLVGRKFFHEFVIDTKIEDAGGVVLKTSLDESKVQILRHALSKATVAETPPPTAKSA